MRKMGSESAYEIPSCIVFAKRFGTLDFVSVDDWYSSVGYVILANVHARWSFTFHLPHQRRIWGILVSEDASCHNRIPFFCKKALVTIRNRRGAYHGLQRFSCRARTATSPAPCKIFIHFRNKSCLEEYVTILLWPKDLVAHVAIDHILTLPRRRGTTEILVEPFQMSIVIERHGTKAAGPVAVVLEHDEAAGNAKCLERGEVL